MSHELFVIDRKPKLDEREESRLAYLRDKLSTAEELGLKAQAESIKTDIAEVERGRLITTSPMSDTELIIWRAWLPTAYTNSGDDEHRHKLEDYNFDRIPQPVLKLWEKHKKSGAFERFEIWTPENEQPDPILIGVNGTMRHLLARWGESDANLVSFDDIKRELIRRWHKNEEIGGETSWEQSYREDRTMKAIFAALMGTVLSFLIGVGLVTWLGLKGGGATAMMFMVCTIVAVSTFICVRRFVTRKLWKSSAIIQAIVKDDSRPRELIPA